MNSQSLLTYGTKRFLVEKLNAKPLFEAIFELMIFFLIFSLIFLLTKFKAHFSVIETFRKVGSISCSKFKLVHTNFFVNFYFLHNKNHIKPFFHILEIGQYPIFLVLLICRTKLIVCISG